MQTELAESPTTGGGPARGPHPVETVCRRSARRRSSTSRLTTARPTRCYARERSHEYVPRAVDIAWTHGPSDICGSFKPAPKQTHAIALLGEAQGGPGQNRDVAGLHSGSAHGFELQHGKASVCDAGPPRFPALFAEPQAGCFFC